MKRFAISLFLIAMSVGLAFAQGTTGRLSGTVSGPDGVLPGATVTAIDNNSRRETTTTTNQTGAFTFQQLEFGTYTITVTASGFKTLRAAEQKIDVGREATLNLTMEIGEVSAVVEVTAGADVITSNTAQVSNTVSPQQILSLPLITRSPLSLTLLQAGTSSNGNTTINGMRTSMTNITRDGINIQDTFIRSNATDFAPGRPSVDDTAEFTITTTNQEADQGYGTAQIRLVTPRGTRDWHGALFAYNRNSAFAANNFFNNRTPNNPDGSQAAAAIKPGFRNRNQYGGKVSGPVWLPYFGEGTPAFLKDKAVFFFSYEGIKDPVSGAATRTILSPTAQAGAFRWNRAARGAAINTTVGGATVTCPEWAVGSTSPAPICNISNILAFAAGNGLAVPTTIDPIIQARILSKLPTTSNFTGGDGLNTGGYRLIRRSDQTRDQYSSRFDFDLDDANSFLFIYNYNKEVNLRTDIDATGFSLIPDGEQSSANTQYTGAYRRVFSSKIVNEFRGGLFKSSVPFYRVSAPNVYNLAIPLVTNPENNFGNQGRDTESWNFQSNGDWIAGSHTFKFGGQLQFFDVQSYNDAPNGNIVPTVSIGTSTNTPQLNAATHFGSIGGISTAQLGTANAMMGLFGGIVTASNQMYSVPDISRGFQAQRVNEPYKHGSHSLYLADRWQVTPQLTLSLGARWEYYPPLTIGTGVALEPLYDNVDDPLPSILKQNGSYVPVGTNSGKKNAYYKPQYDNFAPNIGVAWAPSFEKGLGKALFGSRSVIRGGYSHAFGNDSIITSIRNAAVGNQGLAATNVSAPNQNGRLSGSFVLPTAPTFIQPPRSYLQNNGAGFNWYGTIFGIDPNIEVTRVKQISLGWQREFWGNTAFEARYVGTESNNMVRSVDYNQIDVRSNGFAADFIRAQNNDRLCVAANAAVPGSCTTGAGYNASIAGSQQLPVFALMGGNALLTNGTILGLIRGGTPADLAQTYIQNNLNNHPTVANPALVPFIKFLPNPASGVVNLLQNDAFYRYHSAQFEVRRRFSNGFYFQANYTFSKNLTNAAGDNGSQSLVNPYLDNLQPELDYARADFDQTHAFNFNGVYQLPFGKGKRFLSGGGLSDKIFGGWELSGIVQWNSGVPISFLDPRGTLNRSGRSARQTANTSLTTGQIRDLLGHFEQNGRIYWINPSILCANGAATMGYGSAPCAGQVFFNVEPGQTGTLGRSLINAPSYFNIDATLMKNIRFTESTRLQLRFEAFNLLNGVNFFPSASQLNIGSTTFGQITSAGSSRQVQLAARFEF